MSNINLLVVDSSADEEWSFYKGLNLNNEWILKNYVCNGTQKSKFKELKRYLTYYKVGKKLFKNNDKYSKVVAWQQFFGIFMCYFLSKKKKKSNCEIIILNFIFKEKKGFIGKKYKNFVFTALKCKNIKKIVVLSSSEIEYYSKVFNLPKDMFVFIPIGVDRNPKFESTTGDYFLSAGRSNRDYDFLVESFKKMDGKLVIISDKYKNNNLPSNVTILDSCFGDDYEKMVANCYAMIVSLTDEPISSGQLVVNNAFMYKKPVIVTNNPGIIDYVDDKTEGYIIEKNFDELKEAIDNLKKKDNYKKMSDSIDMYSEYGYGEKVRKLFED